MGELQLENMNQYDIVNDTIEQPEYSVISVGKKNRFGHPNKEVLNNLKQSKVYRTDQDGSIMFKIKNDKLKIKTCSSQKKCRKMRHN